MKKIIAVTIVALMMFALATSAFALLPTSTAAYKNPPVFIDSLVVSDAYMTGLTVQNWTGSLTNQAYAAGSYIWFIAKIGVAAEGDTDAAHLWDTTGDDSAELTFTSKDNCLDFTSANNARLSRIWGQNVRTESVRNSLNIVEATSKTAKFIFRPQEANFLDATDLVLGFNNLDLAGLRMDMIYPKNVVGNVNNVATLGATGANNRATLQKDFYLHFMAITKEATEGVCIGTMKVNGETEFARLYNTITPGTGSYSTYNPWAWGGTASYTQTSSSTKLLPGDASVPYLLFNTVNNKQYVIAKISGESPNANAVGPWGNGGAYYLLMNTNMDKLYVGFAVDGAFKGLVYWWNDKPAIAGNYSNQAAGSKIGSFNYNNSKTWDAANYTPLASNDLSSDVVRLAAAYGDASMATSDLQAIFDFFGFLYNNPRAPGDADFLGRSGLVTVAEAKYNVANATVTVPDTTVVIPKTGDAATSTGLILVASAILAAAAVGFVLSKRAHN